MSWGFGTGPPYDKTTHTSKEAVGHAKKSHTLPVGGNSVATHSGKHACTMIIARLASGATAASHTSTPVC